MGVVQIVTDVDELLALERAENSQGSVRQTNECRAAIQRLRALVSLDLDIRAQHREGIGFDLAAPHYQP